MRAIFSELEVILGYNKLLLDKLEKRMKQWNYYTKLGDVFNTMVCSCSMFKNEKKVISCFTKINKYSGRFHESVHTSMLDKFPILLFCY